MGELSLVSILAPCFILMKMKALLKINKTIILALVTTMDFILGHTNQISCLTFLDFNRVMHGCHMPSYIFFYYYLLLCIIIINMNFTI